MVVLAMIAINVYRYINEEKEKMESLRQRDFIRDTFGRYMSGEVVEELLDSPEGLKMSGEIREVTFLVSDLRGFTALTSRLSPHEIIEVINRYFEHMVDVISKYRGVVNEFLGDGILVLSEHPCRKKTIRSGQLRVLLKCSRLWSMSTRINGVLIYRNWPWESVSIPGKLSWETSGRSAELPTVPSAARSILPIGFNRLPLAARSSSAPTRMLKSVPLLELRIPNRSSLRASIIRWTSMTWLHWKALIR
jgi:class 3 adenylate cyclase